MTIMDCPFCGGEAGLAYKAAKAVRKSGIVFVRCNVCGAQTRVFESDNPEWYEWENTACRYAVDAWNQRRGDEHHSILQDDPGDA